MLIKTTGKESTDADADVNAESDKGTEKPKEEPKPETDQVAKASFLNTLFEGQNRKPKVEEEEPEPEAKTEEEEDSETEAKSEPEAKPDAKLEAEAKSSTLNEVKDAITEGMRSVVDAVRPKEPVEKKEERVVEDPDADLPEKDRKKIPTLQKMEALNPERYKGITEKYRANAKAQKNYIEKWKSENPGERFDPDNSEHDDFYKDSDVVWDEDDFVDAKIELAAERKLANMSSKENERLRKLESAEVERSMASEIEVKRVKAMTETLSKISDDYKEFFKDGKINNEAVKKFAEEEPEISGIVFDSVNTADAIAHETVRMFKGLVVPVLDTDEKGKPKNPIHSFIQSSAIEAEQNILNSDNKVRDGKKFATSVQLKDMTLEEASGHWGIGADEVISVIAESFAKEASEKVKNFEESLEKFAARRGFEKSKDGKSKNKDSKEPDSKKGETFNKDNAKDPSDPTSIETGNEKSVSPDPGKHPENSSPKELFVDRLLRGQG